MASDSTAALGATEWPPDEAPPEADEAAEEPMISSPRGPGLRGCQILDAETSKAPPEREMEEARLPKPLPDGVCKVCIGAKVLRTEVTHSCTNCSGKGYCAAGSGGNRFKCTCCGGTGHAKSCLERSCEACSGSGFRGTPVEAVPRPPLEPQEKIGTERGDSIDKVKFEDQTLVLENLALSMSCLMNFLGLVLVVLGFALLVGRLWFMGGLVITLGAMALAFALMQRMKMKEKRKKKKASKASKEDGAYLETSPLSFDHLVSMATLTTLPNVFVIYFLSDIGVGLKAYSFVAPQHMNLAGDLIVALAFLILCALAIFDWLNWPPAKRVSSAVVPLILLGIGSLLKGRKYSWAPILVVVCLIPLGLGVLRSCSCRNVKRASFYKAAGVCMSLNAVVLLVIWFVWIALGKNEWDDATKERLRTGSSIYEYVYSGQPLEYDRFCGPSRNLTDFARDERRRIQTACSTAATIFFLVYSSPFVAFASNGIMASFCFVQLLARDAADVGRLRQVLQIFGAAVTVGAACFCATVYLSSASFRLGSTLLSFLSAGFVALLVWCYMEIGNKRFADYLAKSGASRFVMQIVASDWAKAGVVIVFNLLIPIGFLMSMLNMKVRRRQGRPSSEARFTPTATLLYDELASWRWASVLSKVCLVAELIFMMQVGVAKVTYIFLSWLNSQLAGIGLGLVTLLAVLVGYIMFMLPPVPGVPVYVFLGIVVSQRARSDPAVGFAGGVVIALLTSFAVKQVACVSQYMIGFLLGKSVWVQQLIGVDKVVTRALEQVLKEPGLSLGKVAILVGGPDWPTSVICGILRLNIPRMVWGTCPVIVVVGPCVLAGAFLSRVDPGEDSIWNLLADAAIGAAAFVNGASFLAAAYNIGAVANRHEEELAKPRPEHAKVAEMTRRLALRAATYWEVVRWEALHRHWKAFISLAAVMQLGCLFVFAFLSEACFREFSVSSDINAELPEGLGGQPLKIVREPFGWFPLGIFAMAVLMHFVFVCRMERLTTISLRGQKEAAAATADAEGRPRRSKSRGKRRSEEGRTERVEEEEPAGVVAVV